MDANEDDGGRSFPPDEPDEVLDGAWSSNLTVYSVSSGATESGHLRLMLGRAEPKELEERLGVSAAQAEALRNYGRTPSAVLTDLLINALPGTTGAPGGSDDEEDGETGGGSGSPKSDDSGTGNSSTGNASTGGARGGGSTSQPSQESVPALSDVQLRALFAETCTENPVDRLPGKMNINTVPAQLLRDIFNLMNLDEAIADEIIFMRSSRPQGILTIVDLKKIPNINSNDLQAITRRFDVISNVFTVSSRGRSDATGLEVEIIAVVDRSTVPVRILEYREQ